jgi:hypothetical protein
MNPERDATIAVFMGWRLDEFPVLSTWIGMGTLATELDKMGLLETVLVDQYSNVWKKDHGAFECFTYKMLDPDRFADEVLEWIRRQGGESDGD